MPGIPRPFRRAALAAAAALGVAVVPAVSASTATATTAPSAATTPAAHYDHVFVVMEENHGYSDVIGNPAAPNLNALADRYGLATSYFGIGHPSEPNYVALLGGSPFGVANDNPYYINQVHRPSLVSQLDRAGISWKAYLQGLPHPGYQGICYPANCNGTPDKDPLYVSKHNPVANFTTSWNAADRSRQVPADQLRTDLASGQGPSVGLIIPDECHDQHGDSPYCLDSGSTGGSDPQDQHLVATGDRHLGQMVRGITSSPFWARGNNAIVVTYDEGNGNGGCCGANPGVGQVATVVVTSHGPRHVAGFDPLQPLLPACHPPGQLRAGLPGRHLRYLGGHIDDPPPHPGRGAVAALSAGRPAGHLDPHPEPVVGAGDDLDDGRQQCRVDRPSGPRPRDQRQQLRRRVGGIAKGCLGRGQLPP